VIVALLIRHALGVIRVVRSLERPRTGMWLFARESHHSPAPGPHDAVRDLLKADARSEPSGLTSANAAFRS